MATFTLATPEQNEVLTAKGQSDIDLTPYTQAVKAALNAGRYGVLTLVEGDNESAERRRVAKAAKIIGKYARFHPDSGEQEAEDGGKVTVVMFRVTDPPKPRAKKE